MSGKVAVKPKRKKLETKGEFIKELGYLRHHAFELGMDRVVLTLEYAYWEVLASETPWKPM